MSGFKSDFMRIVHERGMVHQCSDAARLDDLLSTGTRTAYIGFVNTIGAVDVPTAVIVEFAYIDTYVWLYVPFRIFTTTPGDNVNRPGWLALAPTTT